MEPKSMLKSFSNDFGRSKGRPGPIVNIFRLKKDGKRMLQNRCQKMIRHLEQNKPTLAFRRAGFGAGGEVRRGQAPPGPAISALIQLFNLKRPAPGGVRRILFHEKWPLEPPRVDLFCFLRGFGRVRKNVDFSMLIRTTPKSSQIEPWSPKPPPKMKIRLSSHTRLQESKPPGREPIIKEIQGKNNKH